MKIPKGIRSIRGVTITERRLVARAVKDCAEVCDLVASELLRFPRSPNEAAIATKCANDILARYGLEQKP